MGPVLILHISCDDPDFVAAATDSHWNMKLENQPPKSPDTNVLDFDLSLFRTLQSDQWRSGFVAYNIDELIEKVEAAFLLFDPRKLCKLNHFAMLP
jgi:3-methyladenine DNA glycosylase Tag